MAHSAFSGSGDMGRAWRFFGCRYIEKRGAHRFRVWAPKARAVSVIGDFNGWDEQATP